MAFKDFWNNVTSKPAADKPEQTPKPKEEQQAAKPEGPSVAEQQKQAAKDRAKAPGPAERYLVKNPDVLQKAVDAKAERDKPQPTKHDHVPPSEQKLGPTIQTPMGPMRVAAQGHPQPAPPAVPRKPTNADRMLDRAEKTLPPKPPPKSFRELHPNTDRNRSR